MFLWGSGTQVESVSMEPAQLGGAEAVRQPRLAEIVAAELREEILHGKLTDGSVLQTRTPWRRGSG